MTARRSVTVTDWLTWAEAEALVSGWLTIRPTTRPGNRTGAPDVILARDGNLVAVWVRPGEEGLTKAQHEWCRAWVGDTFALTAEQPLVIDARVTAALAHPTTQGRDLLRKVLA